MKTNVNKKSGVLLGLAAVLMLAAMMIVGCKQAQGNSSSAENKKPETPAAAEKYAVSFEAATLGGKLTAKVDGAAISSGASVEKGKTVTFTAEPLEGYKVEKWELNGTAVNDAKETYELPVNEKASVKVYFKEKEGASIPKCMVTVSEVSNGKVTVAPALPEDKQVPKGQELTITATANTGYEVDKWTISGSSFESGSGADGSTTAKVKVTDNTTVTVTFKQQIVTPPTPPASTDKTYTVGGISFTMKGIAAVTNGNVGHDDQNDNKPHTVSLTAYRIGETEVTQELWEAVMGAGSNPSNFSSGPEGTEVQGKRPVEQVSWYHCIAFCNKLSLKLGLTPCYTVEVSGSPIDFDTLAYSAIPTSNNTDWNDTVLDMSKNGFRLPTEAEWEWAAKGGKDYKWSGTNVESELVSYAWYGDKDHGKTHEVKKKSPNGYGLYDMSGNVWEWCWDRYSNTTPAGGQTDPQGAGSGASRVIRGGSWFLAREPVKNMERSGIFFTINHPLCGCETKSYSKKLSSKAIQ